MTSLARFVRFLGLFGLILAGPVLGGFQARDGSLAMPAAGSGHITVIVHTAPATSKDFTFDWIPVHLATWGGPGSGVGQFSVPVGAALGPDGAIIVADMGNNRVQQWSPGGEFVRAWGWGVATGAAAFESCTTACRAGLPGTGNGQFAWPSAVAVDDAGNIYVADTFGLAGTSLIDSSRVQKFDAVGNFITAWGGPGAGDGQLSGPTGIAVDAAGSILVADTLNQRVQHFNHAGVYLGQWGEPGTGPGEFDWPRGLAAGSDGHIFVADANNARLQQFDAAGHYLATWGDPDGWPGAFNLPYGLAIDSTGTVYLADSFNNRLLKFDATGRPLAAWGGVGTGDAWFNHPRAVLPGGDGRVIVVDSENHRLQVFLAGAFRLVAAAPDDDPTGDRQTIDDLPSGTYTLVERVPPGWQTPTFDCDPAPACEVNGAQVNITLPEAGRVEVHVTNSLTSPGDHALYLPLVTRRLGAAADASSTGTLATGEYRGDADGDGRVELADTRRLLQIVNQALPLPAAGSATFCRADIWTSGRIDVNDAVYALATILGLRRLGPVEYLLPVGDSITVGWRTPSMPYESTPPSYRKPLREMLLGTGSPPYDLCFVGMQTDHKGTPLDLLLPYHARIGITTWGLAGGWEEIAPIDAALAGLGRPPDVALIHLGTNDVNSSDALPDQRSNNSLDAILNAIRAAAGPAGPARIYLARITPVNHPGLSCQMHVNFGGNCVRLTNARIEGDPGPTAPGGTQGFNDLLIDPRGGGDVRLVDMNSGVDPVDWMLPNDGVHPNQCGECRMAGRWYAALRANGYPLLPGLPGDWCESRGYCPSIAP